MQLTKVDREGALLDRPTTQNKTILEIGAPPEIRGVRPEEQVRVLDLQGDALKKVVVVRPPQEVRLVQGSPRDHDGLALEIPLVVKFELKRPHTKTPWDQQTETTDDRASSTRQRRYAACRIKILQAVTEGSKPSPERGKPSKRGSPTSSPDI